MTIELPTNPDIDQLRRQAKNFCSRLDRATQQRSTGSERQPTPVRRCPLADAQRAPGCQYGYPRWPRLRRGVADARGRIIGLRAAHPVFDDKTTGRDALFTHRATRRCSPRSTTVRKSVSRVSALERPP